MNLEEIKTPWRAKQQSETNTQEHRQRFHKRTIVARNEILIRKPEQLLVAYKHGTDSALYIQSRAYMTNLINHYEFSPSS